MLTIFQAIQRVPASLLATQLHGCIYVVLTFRWFQNHRHATRHPGYLYPGRAGRRRFFFSGHGRDEHCSRHCAHTERDRSEETADQEQGPGCGQNAARLPVVTVCCVVSIGHFHLSHLPFSEETENATELELGVASSTPSPPGSWPGLGAPDALNVHVNDIHRQIHSFNDARMSDLANERLPQFVPHDDTGAVPSMRHHPRLHVDDHNSPSEPHSLEGMIRKALLEEGMEDGGVVERLAEKIARGKKASARPRGLLGRTETV